MEAIREELGELYVERITGVDLTQDLLRTMDDVTREIDLLEGQHAAIQLAILRETQEVGNQEFNEVDREITLLTEEYDSRINEYGDLVLAEASVDVVSLGAAELLDITSNPGSPATNGMAGLIAGVLVALGIILVRDKYHPVVWVGSDMGTVPYLGQIVQRSAPLVAGQAWYEFGGPAVRKQAIQSIRVTVEGASSSGSALGLMSIAGTADVHEFAADLAMSMVKSGSRVLLIDADFENPSGLFEFVGGGNGASFSDLLQFRLEDEESYRAFIKRTLTDPAEITSGLTALHTGRGLADPADALAGARLLIILEEVPPSLRPDGVRCRIWLGCRHPGDHEPDEQRDTRHAAGRSAGCRNGSGTPTSGGFRHERPWWDPAVQAR